MCFPGPGLSFSALTHGNAGQPLLLSFLSLNTELDCVSLLHLSRGAPSPKAQGLLPTQGEMLVWCPTLPTPVSSAARRTDGEAGQSRERDPQLPAQILDDARVNCKEPATWNLNLHNLLLS